jgi:signal transduction histidine kinase
LSERSRPLAASVAAGIGAAWLAWAVWLLQTAEPRPVDLTILASVTACTAGGLLVWWQRPDQRFGALLLGLAVLLALPSGQLTRVPLLWTAGTALDSAFALLLAYAALRFPRERLVARIDRLLVASVVPVAILAPIAITAMFDPTGSCPGCSAGLNLLLVDARPDLIARVLEPLFWVIVVQATVVAVRLLWKLRGATRPALRVLAPVVVPAGAWFAAHALTRAGRLLFVEDFTGYDELVAVSSGLLCLVPFGVLAGLLQARSRRSLVGDLVIELGRLPATERVRDAVARTLGDPRAEVGLWVPSSGRYVTAEGDPLDVPAEGDGREVTYVEGRGEPLAAIVHDAALRDEPALIDAVGAAARFAVENERLHAQTLERLEEVRASRARIVRVGDEERRRIERNLHDGAQQRLIAVNLQLRMLADAPEAAAVRPAISAAARELGGALAELRELAQGLHPAVLRDEGLAAAVEYLAERAPGIVRFAVPAARWPEDVEVAAYFVIAEALANAAKHAPGARVDVRVAEHGGELLVEVADDGPGGACLARGTGLRGLLDRVAAIGGTLAVDSEAGRGTTIVARLRCG